MPLFKRKENVKVDEKSLAVRTGNAKGYQKTEEYKKGNTGKYGDRKLKLMISLPHTVR